MVLGFWREVPKSEHRKEGGYQSDHRRQNRQRRGLPRDSSQLEPCEPGVSVRRAVDRI
jgi:hypothetical protein